MKQAEIDTDCFSDEEILTALHSPEYHTYSDEFKTFLWREVLRIAMAA